MKNNKEFLKELILDIESVKIPVITKKNNSSTFEMWDDPSIRLDLSGNIGSFVVRFILNQLTIDEHFIFKWRLDNKYRQYQVLNYYAPDFLPSTFGFSSMLFQKNGANNIRELCDDGYFIKQTLGDGSGRANLFDKTNELDNIIRSYHQKDDHLDTWMIQKKLNLVKEFRIHTFGRDLLYGLTFKIKGTSSSNSDDAEEFVDTLLDCLPDALLVGTLIGWDVGVTDTNEYYIIEANYTGFHPEYSPGFQTSGYFGDTVYGSIICAWFNNYFKDQYQISIGAIDNSLLSKHDFYRELLFYSSKFKVEHREVLRKRRKGEDVSAIVYVGKDDIRLFIGILNFFYLGNFVDMFYIIVNDECVASANDIFFGNDLIQLFQESTLFSTEEYLSVASLGIEHRKNICCDLVKRKITGKQCFVI